MKEAMTTGLSVTLGDPPGVKEDTLTSTVVPTCAALKAMSTKYTPKLDQRTAFSEPNYRSKRNIVMLQNV